MSNLRLQTHTHEHTSDVRIWQPEMNYDRSRAPTATHSCTCFHFVLFSPSFTLLGAAEHYCRCCRKLVILMLQRARNCLCYHYHYTTTATAIATATTTTTTTTAAVIPLHVSTPSSARERTLPLDRPTFATKSAPQLLKET